jgi:flagellum-specific ATP synthase
LSTHEASRTLVDTGLYAAGTSPDIDRAVERHPHIVRFLKQAPDQRSALAATLEALSQLTQGKS